ncbi:MAG: ferrous iron transport protein B [Bacteroidota bacterium]
MKDGSQSAGTSDRALRVALAGNPNSGKSSVFNSLTGLHQKVANFPGVTVEKKTGQCTIYNSSTGVPTRFEVIDLPGTYSLYPKSPDERIPFEVLCDPHNPSHPDLVLLIADGTNLKRSLFLASQVVDLKLPCVLVLNMMDLVLASGTQIDVRDLERRIGVRVVPINARKEEGIEELKQVMVGATPVPEKDVLETTELAPKLIRGLRDLLKLRSDYSAMQIAQHRDSLGQFGFEKQLIEEAGQLIDSTGFNLEKLKSYETLERYKVIQEILRHVVTDPKTPRAPGISQRIDRLLMHRVWGYVFFLFILFLMFQAIFSIAEWPMNFIDETFAGLSELVREALPAGMLNDLVVDGILAGIGGIIIFIPQIALLFTFIAILEDSGYMARVSFLMDKLMRKFGLNGRSVIPLISGAACAVPAILSTRTIGSWKERLITIFVTPLMSCSARLPVYTLLVGLVVPQGSFAGIMSLQGLAMMALYLIGFLAAIGSAALMKYVVKARERAYFIMEIPVYRTPRWSNILYSILEKIRIFLFDAGKVIIAISIVLWFLSSRGPGSTFSRLEEQHDFLEASANTSHDSLAKLQSEMLAASYAGRIGHWLEPAIAPLGFDWKIGIALVTSFAAREVFVGTMTTIYSVGQSDEDALTVREKMRSETDPISGKPRYDSATGWSLMIFYAFAMQCMSTLAVVRRETGGWKWPTLQFLYLSALAYFSSLIVYQVLS